MWRYYFALSLLLAFLGVVVLRLFYWQVVKAEELSRLGIQQYGTVIVSESRRGEIETSDGFPIVADKISYQVYADPKEVKDKELVTQVLAPILKIDTASISAQLSLDKFWVPLAAGISSDTKEKIESLHLDGVGFEQQNSRLYPEASMAAQLVGFVGKNDNGADQGYFGIEGYYNRLLAGRSEETVQIHDAFGKPVLAQMNTSTQKVDGSNLRLSIDRTIQFIAEQKLSEGVEKFGAKSGMVVVMDPHTGNILAMAASPSFDPRSYIDYPTDSYRNPLITDTYEPGSTFKPLIMSAAFDAGLLKPESKCPICAGPVAVGGYDLHTWDDKYYKDTNMIDVIKHSDNTGMVYVAQTLGLDRMISYLQKYGIGDLTNIDLQGEVFVPLKPKENWYAVDLATTGFGQGISITPIELIDAFATLANGGKRMEPHVVSSVESPDGTIVKIPPKVVDQPISEDTAKVMTEILVNAVNKGEASFARLKGYRIAGKTGTASIPVAGHYDPTKTIASFIGFAPAENPKFVMLVVFNRPTTSIYGAETAAPVFFDIAKNILNYYNIPPTEGE